MWVQGCSGQRFREVIVYDIHFSATMKLIWNKRLNMNLWCVPLNMETVFRHWTMFERVIARWSQWCRQTGVDFVCSFSLIRVNFSSLPPVQEILHSSKRNSWYSRFHIFCWHIKDRSQVRLPVEPMAILIIYGAFRVFSNLGTPRWRKTNNKINKLLYHKRKVWKRRHSWESYFYDLSWCILGHNEPE